jgi:hypothetical protein
MTRTAALHEMTEVTGPLAARKGVFDSWLLAFSFWLLAFSFKIPPFCGELERWLT